MLKKWWLGIVFAIVFMDTLWSIFPKACCQQINVSGTKEFLIIHEEPEKYVGATINIPAQLGWLNPNNLSKKEGVDGYIFRFNFGQTLSSAKSFGNNFTLIPNQMNYIMPTNLGRDIIANWKTSGLTNYRVKITFNVEKIKMKGPFNTEKDYYLAVVKSISR